MLILFLGYKRSKSVAVGPLLEILNILDWKNLHCLSERLTSLGIMQIQLRISFKPLNMIVLWWFEGFHVFFKRRQPLGQLFIWSMLFYQSGQYGSKISITYFLLFMEDFIVGCWYSTRLASTMPFYVPSDIIKVQPSLSNPVEESGRKLELILINDW